MGFFKELKEDASQAIKELMPGEDYLDEGSEEDLVVNTLEGELDVESELSKLNGLLESVPFEEEDKEPAEPQQDTSTSTSQRHENTKEEPLMSLETEIPVNAMDNFGGRNAAAPTMQAAQANQTPEQASQQSMHQMQPEMQSMKPETPVATDEVTVITEGSSLTGNIQSKGSIDLRGSVIGDVQCNGKLTVTGTIRGNSDASEFFADNAKLEGEINTSGTVKIGLGSIVIGNITASSAVIAGAIKGDIDVQGPVVVDTSAVVMGNIKSRSVQINNGAVIEGFCSQCYADVDVESLFTE